MNEISTDGYDAATAEHAGGLAALRDGQRFGPAVPAGLLAAVGGALLWALFTYLTNTQLGLIAVAIGALVGYAIRKAGHGVDRKFGLLGAACAALGWALGTILCDVAFLAKEAQQPFFLVVGRLGANEAASLALSAADGMDLLFLAIAVWEGYRLSFLHRLKG
jgi:hypothetical protein